MDRGDRLARAWHLATVVVVGSSLLLQAWLTLSGRVGDPAVGTGARAVRLLSYFTVESNLLVLAAAVLLVRSPKASGPGFAALRLASLIGITVTGVVFVTVLRGLQDLSGLAALADSGLHYASPLLAVGGWLLFGPRPRLSARALRLALLWPVVWLAWTAVHGSAVGWWPYPFVDADELGWGRVALNCVGVFVLAALVGTAYQLADRRLKPAPEWSAAGSR